MKYNKELVEFNLKSILNQTEKTQIFLILNFEGNRLRYYTVSELKAQLQLATTNFPIEKIAMEVGIDNFSYFNRMFK